MTAYHRVTSVQAINDHVLLVDFDNQQRKHYDVAPLLTKQAFAPLANPALFRAVKVEQGGYAVSWNENIDLSEYELWQKGKSI